MSCNRGCGNDFNRGRIRYDNRGLYDSLRYSPFDSPFDNCKRPDCLRRGNKPGYKRWDRRYPLRYR